MDSGTGAPLPVLFDEDLRKIPPRVSFALDVLHWANHIQERNYENLSSENGRKLTQLEQVVYDAALEVLRLYLSGEMNFVEDEEESPAAKSKGCFFCSDKTKTPS
jgi:hypothetical protein